NSGGPAMPYAPVFLPPLSAPSPAVLAAERAIRDAEGAFHVGGAYYADPADADRQRRELGERQVRDQERRARWRERCQARASDVFPAPPAKVTTWLTCRERVRVDAAVGSRIQAIHRDRLSDLRYDLATGCAEAALISAALASAANVSAIAA